MEMKNSQAAAPGAAGVQIRIRKYGRGMGSERPERRYLHLYIEPFGSSDPETGITETLRILNTLLAVWRPLAQPSFFRPDMWWVHISCSHCKQRTEYELERWKAGEYVWHRGMCMRHWLVHHLSMITPSEPGDLLSNRPINLAADSNAVIFGIRTNNYEYSVRLNRHVAEMEVNYKGRQHRFTYRNHLHGFPYLSSYANILFDMYAVMRSLRDFLSDYVLRQRRLQCYLIINDFITLPPAAGNTDGCDVCKL
jgi:hypothetical protein